MTSKLNKTLPEFPCQLGDPQIIDSFDNYYLVESFKVFPAGGYGAQDKRFNIIERVDNPGVASDGSPQYWYNKLVMRGGRQDSGQLERNRSRALYNFNRIKRGEDLLWNHKIRSEQGLALPVPIRAGS